MDLLFTSLYITYKHINKYIEPNYTLSIYYKIFQYKEIDIKFINKYIL